jgi:hypothetical protein
VLSLARSLTHILRHILYKGGEDVSPKFLRFQVCVPW